MINKSIPYCKFAPENGSGMVREWLGIASAFPRKLFTLFFCFLFVGVGNAWGTTSTSITSYADGSYYIIDVFTNQSSEVKYYALNSFITGSNNITGVDVTSYVTINLDGTLTLDLSTITPKEYTLSHSSDTYYIQAYDGTPATLKSIKQATSSNNLAQTGNDWSLVTDAVSYSGRFRFASSFTKSSKTTNTCLLLQGTTWSGSAHVVSGVFKGYAQSNANATPAKNAWYGAGYLYLVPVPPSCTELGSINGSFFWTPLFEPLSPYNSWLKTHMEQLPYFLGPISYPAPLIYTMYISRDFEILNCCQLSSIVDQISLFGSFWAILDFFFSYLHYVKDHPHSF